MNKFLKSVLLSGAAVALSAGLAHAADAPAPVMSWTGIYIGVGGGGAYNFADIDASGYGFVSSLEGDTCTDFTDDSSGAEFGGGCFGGRGAFASGTFAQIGNGADFSPVVDESNINTDFIDALNSILSGSEGDGNSDNGAAEFIGVGKIGADWQVGSNFVIGLAADFRFGSSTIEQSSAATGTAGGDGIGGNNGGKLEAEVSLDNSWSIGGRAGYLASDNILLFVSGGYTGAEASLKTSYNAYSQWDAGNNGGDVEWNAGSSDSEWLNGFYVGGGVDMMLTDHIMAGVEYRYTDLGSIETKTQYIDCCNWTAGAGVGGEASLTSHAVTATISYKFGLGL